MYYGFVLVLGFMVGFIAESREAHAQGDSVCLQWLVVTTSELVTAVEPLKRRRLEQGFQVQQFCKRDDLPNEHWTAMSIENWIRERADSHQGPTYVLLLGDWNKDAVSFLPTCVGKNGRMLGIQTDHGYGLPDKDGVPTVAVGRIPARSMEEANQYVDKVLRFEDQLVGSWTNRLNLWVGHPGGNSATEKRLGETIIQSVVNKSLNRQNTLWSGNCLIDFPNTPFSVDRKVFKDRMKSDLAAGQCFTVYAGHAGPQGFWSEDQFVFGKREWSEVNIPSSPGVFLTTGCFACQVVGEGGEGFLTTAMRNPNGPVASIGSFGESYAAHGQLALDAFVELASWPAPPARLGEYWLPMQQGIGRGKMDQITFWLYDQADGSHGKVSLDAQRLEHLEMWTMLGDPATKIPVLAPSVALNIETTSGSSELTISFDVPTPLANGQIEIHGQVRPVVGTKKPRESRTHQTLSIGPFGFTAKEPKFKQTISLSTQLPHGKLDVRMMLIKDGHGALGVQSSVLK